MEDAAIVALYWARDEQALTETAAKFGAYCRKIADNILHSAHDAEECENDTWLAAWNSMPTNRPARLAPYLGRITRNLALDRFDRAAAQKRGSGQTCAPLDELAECVAAPGSVEDSFDAAETGRLISAFLRTLPEETRSIFLRRYCCRDRPRAGHADAGCRRAPGRGRRRGSCCRKGQRRFRHRSGPGAVRTDRRRAVF